MKPEQQLTNLELSQKLATLGFKQESLFYWGYFMEDFDNHWKWSVAYKQEMKNKKVKHFSAFTVAELLEILPIGFVLGKTEGCYYCFASLEQVWEENEELKELAASKAVDLEELESEDENPANCLAYMICNLIEQKLIKI